jgi:hypothetical protein
MHRCWSIEELKSRTAIWQKLLICMIYPADFGRLQRVFTSISASITASQKLLVTGFEDAAVEQGSTPWWRISFCLCLLCSYFSIYTSQTKVLLLAYRIDELAAVYPLSLLSCI